MSGNGEGVERHTIIRFDITVQDLGTSFLGV